MSVGIIRVALEPGVWTQLPDQSATRLAFQRGDYELAVCAEPGDITFCVRSHDGPFQLDVGESGNCNAFWVRAQLDGPIICLWEKTSSNFLE
jgi:hypothetical protein